MPSEHPSVQSTCPAAMWTRPGNHAHLRDKCVKTSKKVHIPSLIQAFPTEHCHSLVVWSGCYWSLSDSIECLTLPKWLCTFDPPMRAEEG